MQGGLIYKVDSNFPSVSSSVLRWAHRDVETTIFTGKIQLVAIGCRVHIAAV